MRYTYNGENRLISAQPETPAEGDTRVEFVYDYMGRRVLKVVSTYSAGAWVQEKERQFVYDGWNLVKETTISGGAPAVDKYYVWGLDLSQSLQGAGGVGGLLAAVDGSLTYHYLYDANGNVGQVIDASDGSIAARYEYDPYGNLVSQSGDYAEENPYRFSTKFFDSETSLYYYGYRYYLPQLGRWINRDPIGILGSVDLYEYVSNNPLNSIDIFGLIKVGVAFPNGTPPQNQLFKNIVKDSSDSGRWKAVNTGQEMLEFLIDQSKDKSSCIETLTIAGHGWAYRAGSSGGPGIPGVGNGVGFYSNSVTSRNPGSATVSNLKWKVTFRKIRFNEKCTIQIHSCRVAESFARELANVTKCRVVAAASSCFPSPSDGDKWRSEPGYLDERNNSPYTGFYEIIPKTSWWDDVLSFIGIDRTEKHEIGNEYDPE
jgi:RHS repeat-associated protein